MNKVTESNPETNSTKLVLRQLADDYAYHADNKEYKAQAALFTPDAAFKVYYDPNSKEMTQIANGRVEIEALFASILNQFKVTHHLNGQFYAEVKSATKATGLTYCMAHHLRKEKDGKLMVAAVRYYDEYVKTNNVWLIAERKLVALWVEERKI